MTAVNQNPKFKFAEFEGGRSTFVNMDDDDPGPPHSEPLSKKPKISVHKCPEKGCSAQFCRAKLNEHLRVCHGGEDTRPEARFACPSCESSFYNSSQLREHYDIHELACKCRSSKCMKTGKKKVFHSMSILARVHKNKSMQHHTLGSGTAEFQVT